MFTGCGMSCLLSCPMTKALLGHPLGTGLAYRELWSPVLFCCWVLAIVCHMLLLCSVVKSELSLLCPVL